MKSTALFCLALAVLVSAWDATTKLAEHVSAQAFYLDSSTGITHVAWCQQAPGSTDVYLYYKQITVDKKQTQGRQLEGVFGCKELAIDGQDNGKLILIAFSGARISGETVCTEKRPSGCVDVFFKETKDGGFTWADSFAVHRNDVNDAANRMGLRLIHDKVSSHTLLVYLKNSTDQEYSSLFHVMRDKPTKEFSDEKPLLTGDKLKPDITATNPGRPTPVLHLAWSELIEGKYIGFYARSADWRKTWSKPASLMKRTTGPPQVKFGTSRITPGMVFLAYPDIQYKKWLFKWSRDQGLTWSAEISGPTYHEGLALATYMINIKTKARITLFALSAAKDEAEFGTYDFQSGTYSQAETPFRSVENKVGPALTCTLSHTKKSIVVEGLIAEGDGVKALRFATHEYTPISA